MEYMDRDFVRERFVDEVAGEMDDDPIDALDGPRDLEWHDRFDT